MAASVEAEREAQKALLRMESEIGNVEEQFEILHRLVELELAAGELAQARSWLAQAGQTIDDGHLAARQGRVIQEARDRARVHLRAGEPFVWNATNIGLDIRRRIVALCAGYKARVRFVYVEVPCARLVKQNRQRAHVVPAAVMDRLMRRWTVPTLLEAHEVIWHVAP